MTWGPQDPNWEHNPIPKVEADFGWLFNGMKGSDAPTGHFSFIMAGLAMYGKMKRVVELGVHEGATSLCLAYAMQRTGGLAVGIDIEECQPARLRIERLHLDSHWAFIQGRTQDVDYDKVPIDLLFIDAGHSREECQADWDKWTQWVPPGGWVFIDNTISERGVREWLSSHLATAATFDWQWITCQQSFGMAMFRRKWKGEVNRLKEGWQDR